MELRTICGSRRSGTSLVELLVVIVIFLVGILAVIQIFPRGFQIIANTRSTTMMVNLVRTEMDRISGRTDQLPEQILPVIYLWSGSDVVISPDPNRGPDDIGPFTNRIDENGNILDAGGNNLGRWSYLSGANNFRRIIGEGGPVPAPRRVGSRIGGLTLLQFAPVVFNPSYQSLFQVYGNDMNKRFGDPPPFVRRDFEYYVVNDDDPSAEIWIAANPAKVRKYRLAMTAWVSNGGATQRREVLTTISVPAGAGYVNFPLSAYAGLQGGETFHGAEWDSIRLARRFDPVVGFTADPYEYQLLDETLGLILFNPTGYNAQEQRNGRRIPLVAKVDYDVYDWRIIREEFRISDSYPTEQRLKLSNLMTTNRVGPDGKFWPGLNVFVSDELGGTENRDFIVLDMETGGIVSKASLRIDYSIGLVTFVDADNNPANGVQIGVIFPGDVAPSTVTANGRAVRCLYSAVGEWAVQVTKAAASYRSVLGTPGVAEFYAGGAGQYYLGSPLAVGESLTRIYFPRMDLGKKVTIGKIWYDVAGGGEPRQLLNQDFVITNSPADPAVGLPYIDIRTQAADAVSINYARYGYGVRGIRGASVSVRALWNPTSFTLTNDEAVNLENFERWGRAWRRVQTDTFLTKEDSL
ncbi:MAG: type II secretion system protein [Methanoregulaceae archaeon]|nr:type II secretion system protein [Methanoregulaceae archaeon]